MATLNHRIDKSYIVESISIIMPARNAAMTIKESMMSILMDPLVTQLVVVDDISTDNTKEIVQSIEDKRICLVFGAGEGIAAAFNRGLAASTGSYIARCDADDLYVDGRLEWQLNWLRGNEDYVAISAGYQTITESNKKLSTFAADGGGREITDLLLQGEAIINHMCTWLIRAEALKLVGGARSWFETSEDADLVFRLASCGRIWHEPRVAYFYRIHDASITHSKSNSRRKFYNAMAMEFAKQRVSRGSDDLEQGSPPEIPPDANEDPLSTKQHIINQLVGEAWKQFHNFNRVVALKTMMSAVLRQPLKASLWRGFFVMLVKSIFAMSESK